MYLLLKQNVPLFINTTFLGVVHQPISNSSRTIRKLSIAIIYSIDQFPTVVKHFTVIYSIKQRIDGFKALN